MKRALLLSGGVDSAALAHWIRPDVCITVDYGQNPALAEIAAAENIAKRIGSDLQLIHVNCGDLGCGDLSNSPSSPFGKASEWWPFRNQLLVTLAAMKAIQLNLAEIIVGTVISDHIHLDGSPNFFEKLGEVLALQEGSILLSTPAAKFTSEELIAQSGLPLDMLIHTFSCHRSNLPCGACRGCAKRFSIFQKFGL